MEDDVDDDGLTKAAAAAIACWSSGKGVSGEGTASAKYSVVTASICHTQGGGGGSEKVEVEDARVWYDDDDAEEDEDEDREEETEDEDEEDEEDGFSPATDCSASVIAATAAAEVEWGRGETKAGDWRVGEEEREGEGASRTAGGRGEEGDPGGDDAADDERVSSEGTEEEVEEEEEEAEAGEDEDDGGNDDKFEDDDAEEEDGDSMITSTAEYESSESRLLAKVKQDEIAKQDEEVEKEDDEYEEEEELKQEEKTLEEEVRAERRQEGRVIDWELFVLFVCLDCEWELKSWPTSGWSLNQSEKTKERNMTREEDERRWSFVPRGLRVNCLPSLFHSSPSSIDSSTLSLCCSRFLPCIHWGTARIRCNMRAAFEEGQDEDRSERTRQFEQPKQKETNHKDV